MTVNESRSVVEERVFDATPEELWRAWTNADGICGWFLDELRGRVETGERIEWVWTEFCSVQPLLVEQAETNQRLVLRPLTAGWPDGLIEITITGGAGGKSTLRLVQSGFRTDVDWDDEYEGVRSGWSIAFALLGEYLRHQGKKRAIALATRKASFEFDKLAPCYRDADRLSEWLTRSGAIGDDGDPVALVLHDNSPLSGRVLRRTSNEVALSWHEIDGTVELKAYTLPDSRAVALLASSWKLSEAAMKARTPMLEAALDRLVSVLES